MKPLDCVQRSHQSLHTENDILDIEGLRCCVFFVPAHATPDHRPRHAQLQVAHLMELLEQRAPSPSLREFSHHLSQ